MKENAEFIIQEVLKPTETFEVQSNFSLPFLELVDPFARSGPVHYIPSVPFLLGGPERWNKYI